MLFCRAFTGFYGQYLLNRKVCIFIHKAGNYLTHLFESRNHFILNAVLTVAVFSAEFLFFIFAIDSSLPLFLLLHIIILIYVASFFRPMVGILSTIILIFINNVLTINIGQQAFPALFLVLPIYSILFPRIIKAFMRADKDSRWLFSLILCFWIWTAMSAFWSEGEPAIALLTFSCTMLAIQVLVLLEDKRDLYKMLHYLVIVGVLLGILLVISIWHHGDKTIQIAPDLKLTFTIHSSAKRPGGFEKAPIASIIMNVFILIAFGLLYPARKAMKILIGLAALFFVICVFITASKAAVVGLIFGLAFLILLMPFFRNVRIRLLSVFAMIISFVLLTAGNVIIKRIGLLMEKGITGKIERPAFWAAGFQGFKEANWLLGLGIAGVKKYVVLPHSLYFSIIFELGIVGIIFFLMIVVSVILYIKNTLYRCVDNEMRFLIYSIIVALMTVGMQFTIEGDYSYMIFWLTLSIAAAVSRVANNERRILSLQQNLNLQKKTVFRDRG